MSLSVGHRKEGDAIAFLQAKGMRLLTRNYRTKQGEIDIVCLDGDSLVFVEVKYRASDEFGRAVDCVRPAKIRRILKAAWHYIGHAKRPLPETYRLDVIAIDGDDISYFRNVPTA